jgi:hypothetical protein
MAKAEISWKRVTEDGVKLQVYAQHVGREWKFFQREKRFDLWRQVPDPPLEDWMELLEAMQRLIVRRRYQPDDEEDVRKKIKDRYPDADV